MNKIKKVGRPANPEKDYVVRISTTTSPELKKLAMESGLSARYFFEYGVRAILGSHSDKELLEIEKELAILESKVEFLKSRRAMILSEKKDKHKEERK